MTPRELLPRRPHHPISVLQVGPGPGSVGGMAQVARQLQEDTSSADGITLTWLDSGGGRGGKGYLSFPRALTRVAKSDADVVHLHLASGGSLVRKAVLAQAAHARNIPYVVHLHGGGFADFVTRARWGASVARGLFTRAAHVVTLGSHWQDWAIRTYDLPPCRVSVVPNGSRDMGPVRPGGPTVLFLGRLERAKGVDLLLDSIDELGGDPELAGWNFEIVGPRTDDAITTRALSGVRTPRVSAPGPLTGDELREAFERASVFVLPSRAEAMPLSVLEAMSAGLAVVATDVGSVPEVLRHGDSGLLVRASDQAALTHALRAVMADPALRARLGTAAREQWEANFSSRAASEALASVWARAAAAG